MENWGPLGSPGDFMWLGKLFPDYLDMFQWKNMTSDTDYLMLALLNERQFKLIWRQPIDFV